LPPRYMRGKALCFHGEQGQIRVGKIDRCHKGICIYFVFKTHVCMHASAKDVRPESSMTWRLIGSLWYVDTIRMGDVAFGFGWRACRLYSMYR
jgi:hypothetical protein